MGKQRKKQCEAIIQDKKSPSVLGIKYLMPLALRLDFGGRSPSHSQSRHIRTCMLMGSFVFAYVTE